jgi:hypothetical protein
VLHLDEGQVRYFVPREAAVSRVLLSELAHYHERLRQRLIDKARCHNHLDFLRVSELPHPLPPCVSQHVGFPK